MKENEFLDGVSNIEPDVVERFVSMDNKLQKKANKSKTKGIWLRFGAIAACFLLIVSAVIVVPMLREGDPGVIVPPDETNNDVGVNPGPEATDDPVINLYEYAVVNSEGLDAKFLKSFSESSVVGLYTDIYQKQLDDVDTSKTSPFTSENASYQYSNCSELRKGSGVDGDFYSVYDVYDNGLENLIYLHESNLLCQYFYREDAILESVDMNEEEALMAANTFLTTFLTQGQLEKFGSPVIADGPAGVFLYTIKYVRQIAGYATDETLTVFISLSGKVVGYNGDNLDKYDAYVDSITTDNVSVSKTLLETRLQSLDLPDYTISDPIIVSNTEGKLFLRVDVQYVDEYGMTKVESCMISIADTKD